MPLCHAKAYGAISGLVGMGTTGLANCIARCTFLTTIHPLYLHIFVYLLAVRLWPRRSIRRRQPHMDYAAPPPPSPTPPLPRSPPPPMPDDGSTPPPLPHLCRESISMDLDSSSEQTVGPAQQGHGMRQGQRSQEQVQAQEGTVQELGRGQGSEGLQKNGIQGAQRGIAPAETGAQAAAAQDAGPSPMQQVGTLQHAFAGQLAPRGMALSCSLRGSPVHRSARGARGPHAQQRKHYL